jgi:four helix bundle protein
MATIGRFQDIDAWKAARQLTAMVYDAVGQDRFAKDWRLRDQLTGAAISIMANIAEGFGCDSNAQFITFVAYAGRSAAEVESLLYVALDRQYVTQEQFAGLYAQAEKTANLIGGFVRYLRTHPDHPRARSHASSETMRSKGPTPNSERSTPNKVRR